MDAFDNPARNGMAGPQRDSASTDQSNQAVAGSEFLAAAANVTATASIIPLAIQAILVPDASGRIILPAGASIDDITVSGADLVITLPNGQVFIIPGGAVDIPSIVLDGDTVPASTVAQLLENLGELNPEAGVRSSGGNFADPEGPIQDAYALGDLLPYTELAFPQPEERELLPDVIDEEPEIVIVTPDQPTGVVAATASVNEAGLPARGNEPAGSNSAANSETTTGSIVYDAGDGLDSITINGTVITTVGQVVTTPLGQLTITSLTPGNVGYSYTLTDNTNANNNVTDPLTVVVTDNDGDTATATLTISVVDDVPTARNDTDQVAVGSFAPETGNVLTGAGTTSGAAGADTPGADGATLTGIRGASGEGNFSAPGTVQGQYGTLTINAQGGYSYVRTPGTPGGVNDVFTYRITDGDGDTSTATLTISIADAPTVITFVPGDGEGNGGTIVYEADLAGRAGETPGSTFAAGEGGGGGASTSGTITFTAIDGVGSVSIGGVVVTPGSLPQTVASDATGTLVVTGYAYNPATGQGSVTYVYTLIDNTLDGDGSTVSFALVITDADGDAATDTLDIDIVDDAPIARADSDSVTEDGPTTADGNVLTGAGGEDGNATDGVADVQGADGATVTAVAGGAVGEPLAGAYGSLTLNSDGSYSYVLDNASQPVQGLAAGETLTETFTYTITDGDGDTSTTTLTITINGANDGVTINGLNAEGGELVVNEDDLIDGSSPDAAALTQSGSFTVSTPDGLGNVTIGGVPVVTNGIFTAGTATSPLGTVNITGFTPVLGTDGSVIGGTFTYNYVLSDNTLTHGAPGEDSVTDSFAVVVTDSDGSSANASLDVRIIDDVPTALNDADSVTEDSGNGDNPATADGNVLTGLGGGDANATDGVADTQGADGATVTAVAGGTLGEAFAGAYGSLTLNADGSYTYVLNNGAQPVQGLSAGETLTETFTYTITDGDGDTATATLTITINGADDGVTINGLNAEGAEVIVNEDDLIDGSSPDEGALTQTNNFTVSTPDGLGNVTIGGVQVVTNGVFTAGTATSPLGVINITGFTPVIGADGSVTGGTFTYNYVLSDNTLTHTSQGEDFVGDSFAVVVTDSDGSSANASLDVRIIDDVPTAADDSAGAAEDTPVVINVLGNDVRGADGVDPATGVALGDAPTKGSVVYNGDGTFTYTPTAGQEGSDSFTYTITDGDGDTATATVTVTLAKDSVPTIDLGADNSVDEAGLPAGSNAASNSETTTGSFTLTTGNDSVDTLLINGVDVTAGGTVTTSLGVLTVTVSGGAYSYSYTLTTNTAGDNTSDSFTAVVTDSDGDTATDTLVINIIDDIPTAKPDVDSVTEDSGNGDNPATADGNVLTGTGGTDANTTDGVADVQGADGASVTGVNFGATVGTVGAGLAGAYGTLTLNADGSYSYVLNNAAQPVQGLSAGETLTEIFTYTITDGDGDPATTTLTITINGADDGVTINGLNAEGAELFVDEDDLPVRPGEAPGSDTSPDGVTDSNSFSVSTPDGMGTVVLTSFNGVPLGAPLTLVVANGAFTPQFVQTAYGTLNVTGFTPVTGADGSVIGGTFTYSYTLTDNRTDHPSMGEDSRTDSVGVTVTDIDGSTASSTIDIRITDDVPTAVDDGATQAIENAPVTINVLANDVQGADSVQPSAVQLVGGSLTGTGTLVNNGDGTFTYTPGAQETGNVSFQYRIADGDGDTSVATATITLTADSAPQIRTPVNVTVDEDGLAGANADNGLPGEVASTGSASANGTIIVNFGSDVPATLAGSLVLNDSAALDTQLTVGGVAVTFAKVGNDLVGSVAGNEVIRISLTTATAGPGATEVTYGYTVTLSQAIDQAVPGSEDSDFLPGIGFTVTDGDGTTSSGAFGVTIVDDLPTLNVSDTPISVVEGATANGTWTLDKGADGVTSVNVNFGGTNQTLSLAPGSSVSIVQPTGTLTVNANGTFSFTAAGNQNNAANPSASFTLSAVDRDGDPTSDSLTIAITDGANPVNATPITVTVNEAALNGIGSNPASNAETASGNLSFTAGSDTLSGFAFTGVAGLAANIDGAGTDLFWTLAPGGQTIIGSLTLGGPAAITISLIPPAGNSVAPGATASATVTVTLADNLPHELAMAAQTAALGTVTVQATDTDGDIATGVVTVQVIDDIPSASVEPSQAVAEGATVTGTLDFVPGADGASVTHINGTVLVFGGDNFSQAIDIGNGTIKVKADGSYSFTADASVVGPGAASASFTVTDGDGDPATSTISFTITDANVPTAGTTLASVDDDALSGGNPGGTGDLPDANDDGDNNQATFGGVLVHNFGGDGAGSIGFAAMNGTTGTVGTETVTYGWNGLTNTLTATGPRGVLFTVQVTDTATGAYKVTLLDNVLHATANAENDATATLSYTVTDADGSPATGSLQITFDDDTPTLGVIPNGATSNNPAAVTTTGAIPFSVGADSPATVGTITANVSGMTSGGHTLVTNQSGNVLTAYADTDNDGIYDPGTDTAVFTLTVNPGTSQYVFDLLAPLDGDVVNTPISGASSFGAGPTQSQILTGGGGDVSVVAGWMTSGAFNAATWYSTGATNPAGLTLSSVNGSTGGWGIANNNFNNGEFMRFDFGAPAEDFDGPGGYTPPPAILPEISYATFSLTNFAAADTLQLVVHYTDGTFGNLTTAGNVGTLNLQAPAGKFIDWIDIYGQSVGGGGGKISLTNAGVTTTTVAETIGFTVTLTDADGDPVTGDFSVSIADGAPIAVNDDISLTEGGPSFVVFDVDTNDNPGPDGFGSRTFTSVTGTYGSLTLNGDGTQTYTLNATGQAAIDALPPGQTLTDIFNYTLTDTDGDSDSARVTVTLTGSDDGVTITNLTPEAQGGDVTVDEDDLLTGSSPNAAALTATGTFNISAPDGVANLSVHGTQVIANGVFTAATITTPLGNTLKITAYNAATGEVSYTYTLNAAETHATGANENSLFENFTVSLTDTDGDTTSSTLAVNIIDDVPTARPDADIIVAEDAAAVGGNLLTNDTRGADGATVTSVTIGATTTAIAPAGTTTITTANGVYTFTAAGVWTFDPNPVNNAAAVNAGFSYTITDSDGDPSTSTQVISLTDGANPIGGGSITLALDDQNLSDGSTPAGPDSANGTLVFTPGADAIASIVFAASLAGLGGGLTWVRVSDTQITGSDGARLVVTLDLVRVGSNASVTATLNDNYDDHPGVNVDDLVNLGSVGVVATDTDGDTATGTVTVTVSDDLPTVTLTANDTNSVLLTTQDAETIGAAVSDTATSTANFGGVFVLNSAYGADGAGTTTLNYSLGLAVANGGLASLSSNGAAIRLYTQPDGSIVGSTSATAAGVTSANTIFSLAVNAGGAVTLTQFAEIDHATPGNTAGPYDGQFATLANSLVNLTGTATITDADGDTRTSTTSIDLGGNIRFADDGPSIAVAAPLPILTVDESNFGANAMSAAVFTTNYGADGPGTVTYALGINAGSTGLVDTATGQAVVLTLVGNQVVGTAGAGGPTVFTVAVDASGNITLDQIRAIAHDVDGGPGAAHDDAKTLAAANLITVTGTITDGDGDSAKATINIGQQLTFKDDGPTTTADSGTTTEATLDFNAAFVIDFSGSIDNTELNTLLSAVREAGLLLFGSSSGNVSIRLIGFSSTASNLGVFTDPVSFVNAVDGYNPAEGGSRPFNDGTDFTAGIETLMDFYVPSPTASNQVFFLSDGNPNEQTGTGGNSLADATRADWINFVNAGNVNVTAIGVGDGISVPRLQDVNVDGGPAPIVVTDFDDLVATLLDAVVALPVSGDLDANDNFGGDGGRILSITVSGTTYTWDGNNTIARTGTLTGNVAGNSISATTPEGATLTLNFATGIWSYAPDATPTAATEIFNYSVIDGDGDTAGSTLTVTVVDGGGPGGGNIASADIVITNASGSGAAIQIAEAALLANDQAGTAITGAASNITDATGVTRGGGNFTFTDNDTDGGSFFYATTPTDTARVTVNRAQAGETQLDGTSANDILVGRDGADDTIVGKTGSDYMYGLGGNDTFNLANGHFGAGEFIDGGAGTDSIVLTNATTVNFTTGTIIGVETLTGSGSNDSVTMSAQQWAAFNTINLAGGSDTLTVTFSGALDISGASATAVSNVETGNLSGSGGADAITLTGAQLDAILNGSGTIDLGGGADTINLTSTSSDLNALANAGLSGVEVISAAGAGAGVTITLGNQTEALTIVGSASGDTLTGGSGIDTISGGAGADTITGGGGADVLTGDAGNDRFLLANGNFVAGESINGGADNDTIELTNATAVDFTTGTISSIETLTGSTGLDNVTMSIAQWLSFSAIDLGGNTNDVLTITFSGAVNLTAASLTAVSNVEVGNITGSSGADTLTLTGAQLDAILQASGTIDLGGNATDTIVLTSTSADLNGLADGRLVNVEAVSASGAAAGVTINLGNQAETIAITGSANGDAITASTGTNSVVNAGAGADTVTINAGALTPRNWTVDLGSDAAADKIVFNHDAVGTGDDTVVTVSSFNVAQDKIAVSVAGTSETDGTFVTVTGTQTNIAAGTEIIELVNNSWVTTSLGNDGNGSTIEGFIQAATNAIPTGTYTFIVYSDATGTANAGIYSVTISDATDPGNNGMVVEHIMTINGVGYGNLSAANFVGAADPIILDLNGDGYSFGPTAAFDINADGAADRVTWNSSNDGILAVDLDGNGTIDNGTEIFTPGFGGGTFANGVAALASLDDNGDGVVDANDAAFAKLLVWQDANADGVSDAGELSGLADHGIVSIATGAAHADETIDGQTVTARGTFTRADGSTGDYIEAQLDTQLGTRASAREAEDVQRSAGNQALTSSLVAASLVAVVSEAQPDNVAPQPVATEEAQVVVPTETGAAVAAPFAPAGTASGIAGDSLSETPKAATPDHSATLHSDDHSAASIDDAQDSGWRTETGGNSDPADSDSLFDMIADRGPSDTGVMDGLLALGALPAAAGPAGADVAAHDPAAVAVLAEVMETGAVDHLINAIVGSGEPVQVAASETPAFDLAQFLDQKVAPDVAFPISQPLEQDLHNMAAA